MTQVFFTKKDAVEGWVPPKSPHNLIQETLWPSEWRSLAFTMMLNCTSRRQVETVWPRFILFAPTAAHLLVTPEDLIVETIGSLGFGNRRTQRLFQMSRAYLYDDWESVAELPGVGEYGTTSWEIFTLGRFRSSCPKDGVLGNYWDWCPR